MLKKLLFIIICCLMLTACGGEEVPDQRPKYCGESGALFYMEVSNKDIEDYKVPDGFITRKMSSDIKKVIKEHQSKDNSEDGSIDEETAVDIAIAIIKNKVPSYFQKPTSYSLSYSSDDDAYFISISQDHENVNLIDDRQVNLVISKKDGAFLAIWGIF